MGLQIRSSQAGVVFVGRGYFPDKATARQDRARACRERPVALAWVLLDE
jgi:hypothetical protein